MSERPPQLVVPELTHAGIRYQQAASFEPAGPGAPRGAYLAASDAATGAPLWSVLVYELVDDPDWPLSVDRDRNIKSLTLLPDESGIAIEDDVGHPYQFDFATRQVRDLSTPRAPREPQENLLAWATPPATPKPEEDDLFAGLSFPDEPTPG